MGFLSDTMLRLMKVFLFILTFIFIILPISLTAFGLIFASSGPSETANELRRTITCEKADIAIFAFPDAELLMPVETAQHWMNSGKRVSFCAEDDNRHMIGSSMGTRSPNKLPPHKGREVPLGITQIYISSGIKSADDFLRINAGKRSCMKSWGRETCIFHRNFETLPMSVRYFVNITPHVDKSGNPLPATEYPHGNQPRENWDQMHEDVENYILSFVMEN